MADTTPQIPAALRTEFGKGAARRIRRAHQVPVVLYGHGTDPVHLSLPGHETWLALKGNPNALLRLDIEGTDQLALTKDVQRDPVHRTIDHLDLVIVRRGEKVSVDISVHVEGESAAGTIHTLESQTLTVLAEATHIPEHLTADIDGLVEGDVVRASEVRLGANVELESDPETAVVLISVPRASAEDLEADAVAAEAGAAAGDAGEAEDSDEAAGSGDAEDRDAEEA